MPRPALTEKTDLADRLGVDIRTLRNWEKKDNFPGLENYDAIVAWRDVNGLGLRGNRDLAEVKLEIANHLVVGSILTRAAILASITSVSA